jgi:hypothetical protein
MAFDRAYAQDVLNHTHGRSVLDPVGELHVRLMTTNGNAANAGVELPDGGGYASGIASPEIVFGDASASTPSVSTSIAAISVAQMPASTIVGIEIWDSSPRRLEYGSLASSVTLANGDTLTFAAGAITSALG